jgi:hypothetical protein
MINGGDNVVKPMVGDDTVVNITKNVGSLDFVNNILGKDINPENYNIMQKTFIGNAILYWNFISIWLLVLLANKVKKLDY